MPNHMASTGRFLFLHKSPHYLPNKIGPFNLSVIPLRWKNRLPSLLPGRCTIVRPRAPSTAALRRERRHLAQILDAAKQQLDDAVRGTGCVARQLVTGQLHLVERQTSLRTPVSDFSALGQETTIVLGVVGDVERGGWVFLKALKTVPGHVLDREERSVRVEEEV